MVLEGLHSSVSHRPTRLSAASRCFGVSVRAICWDKRVVRNSESETAAERLPPEATSSAAALGAPLCRPGTLTSVSTLGNRSAPHKCRNKDGGALKFKFKGDLEKQSKSRRRETEEVWLWIFKSGSGI